MNGTRARYDFAETDNIHLMANDAGRGKTKLNRSGDDFIEFYHATSKINAASIREQGIRIDLSRSNLDFGKGFYTTLNRVQAENWAARIPDGGEVLAFRINTAELDRLNGLGFNYASPSWRRFVRHNRLGGRLHNYDYVEGQMLGRPARFLQGGDPQAWGHQISWHSRKAVALLMKGLLKG